MDGCGREAVNKISENMYRVNLIEEREKEYLMMFVLYDTILLGSVRISNLMHYASLC